jgi:hypothetical protein
MHSNSTQFPTVRLVAAGCLSLALVLWAGCFDNWWQLGLSRYLSRPPYPTDEIAGFITLAISLLILAILLPVLRRGGASDRWLAVLLAAFPFSLFVLTMCGLLHLGMVVRL